MKLDNRGWSLKEMLFLSACILIALLVAAYLIYSFYQQMGF